MTILRAKNHMLNALSDNDTAMGITAHEAETDPGIARAGEIERMDLSVAHGHDRRKSIENQTTTDPADEDRSRLPGPQTQLHATKLPKRGKAATQAQRTHTQPTPGLPHPPPPPPPTH